jgi:hypothetical protein
MPYRFAPIGAGSNLEQLIAAINANFAQLDQEAVTKVFKQANGNVIIEGKLPFDGGYGTLYYDTSLIPRLLIGLGPDGEVNITKSKDGVSVLDVFD